MGRHHAHAWQSNVLNIAPKKPNWDLKRDLDRKLKVLERRTQVAIVELIRTCAPSALAVAMHIPTIAVCTPVGERLEMEEDEEEEGSEEAAHAAAS